MPSCTNSTHVLSGLEISMYVQLAPWQFDWSHCQNNKYRPAILGIATDSSQDIKIHNQNAQEQLSVTMIHLKSMSYPHDLGWSGWVFPTHHSKCYRELESEKTGEEFTSVTSELRLVVMSSCYHCPQGFELQVCQKQLSKLECISYAVSAHEGWMNEWMNGWMNDRCYRSKQCKLDQGGLQLTLSWLEDRNSHNTDKIPENCACACKVYDLLTNDAYTSVIWGIQL